MDTDGWIHAHWQQLLLGLVVAWAMIGFAWKALTNKFVTRDHLQDCRDDVRKVDEDLDMSIRKGMADLSTKIDRLDDRRREDAINNAADHQEILHDMAILCNTEVRSRQ
jgi:hypothetical protein